MKLSLRYEVENAMIDLFGTFPLYPDEYTRDEYQAFCDLICETYGVESLKYINNLFDDNTPF